jgi:predicted transcriptional regulator
MSKRTSVRIPDDLYAWLEERARKERRTVSNLLVALLAEARDRESNGRDQPQQSTRKQ